MRWEQVHPVLRATYDLIDENEQTGRTSGEAVCGRLGLPGDDDAVAVAIRQLNEAGYVKAEFNAGGTAFFIEPTAAGLEYCSGWPAPGGVSDFLTVFLSAVAERADAVDTPEEEKSRLRRFLEAANGPPKELLAEIMTKLIEGQAGR
jgi:hypothetical protein